MIVDSFDVSKGSTRPFPTPRSDSTRYTKALDVFSKLKKEYALKAKDLKADVAEYKSHRHAAHQFRRELQQINDEMEILEDELKAVREEMKENEHDQARVQAIISQVQDFIMEEQDLQQDMVCEILSVCIYFFAVI